CMRKLWRQWSFSLWGLLVSCFYFRFVLPLLRHQTGLDRDVTMMAILIFFEF
ncbi:hypothetical protein BDV34DRAFT_199250, partial [Aspergillus parasiticus]